jgi:hypothetical protein
LERDTLTQSMLLTFLELGDATSVNLQFAHTCHGGIFYGEETITESNLLEVRRRHHPLTELDAISKGRESRIGADWEWIVKGRRYTLLMRVQAKRTKKNGVLSVSHTVASTSADQMSLLIQKARPDFRPVYCFYSEASDRSLWKPSSTLQHGREYEYGCLLADARAIRAVNSRSSIKRIKDVEHVCFPWHYLFQRRRYEMTTSFSDHAAASRYVTSLFALPSTSSILASDDVLSSIDDRYQFPTVDDLNGYGANPSDLVGVHVTSRSLIETVRSRALSQEQELARLFITDVSEEPNRRLSEGASRR